MRVGFLLEAAPTGGEVLNQVGSSCLWLRLIYLNSLAIFKHNKIALLHHIPVFIFS